MSEEYGSLLQEPILNEPSTGSQTGRAQGPKRLAPVLACAPLHSRAEDHCCAVFREQYARWTHFDECAPLAFELLRRGRLYDVELLTTHLIDTAAVGISFDKCIPLVAELLTLGYADEARLLTSDLILNNVPGISVGKCLPLILQWLDTGHVAEARVLSNHLRENAPAEIGANWMTLLQERLPGCEERGPQRTPVRWGAEERGPQRTPVRWGAEEIPHQVAKRTAERRRLLSPAWAAVLMFLLLIAGTLPGAMKSTEEAPSRRVAAVANPLSAVIPPSAPVPETPAVNGKVPERPLAIRPPHQSSPSANTIASVGPISSGTAAGAFKQISGPSNVAQPVSTGFTGQDFGAEARLLHRIAACGSGDLPIGMDAAVVEKHCRWLLSRLDDYRLRYLAPARSFFDRAVPRNLPEKIVYPFGGGDLLSVLSTYPFAREITTVSLELAGDPRGIHQLDGRHLESSLDSVRRTVGGLLAQNNSTSESLQAIQRGGIPGQLTFFLIALSAHRCQPTSLRFFRIERDGSLHYFSSEEIQLLQGRAAEPLHKTWLQPDFGEIFANSELRFRCDSDSGEQVRVHRHIAANLRDDQLDPGAGLMAYLEKQGRVAAMTKAASYCLWNSAFSRIRAYLLTHMEFMVSDSTGIPPQMARGAGFTQVTYGNFQGSFLKASAGYNVQFRKLWAEQPYRKLSFRYGYVDSTNAVHLMLTQHAKPYAQ